MQWIVFSCYSYTEKISNGAVWLELHVTFQSCWQHLRNAHRAKNIQTEEKKQAGLFSLIVLNTEDLRIENSRMFLNFWNWSANLALLSPSCIIMFDRLLTTFRFHADSQSCHMWSICGDHRPNSIMISSPKPQKVREQSGFSVLRLKPNLKI